MYVTVMNQYYYDGVCGELIRRNKNKEGGELHMLCEISM
jgi:hypothetical protein